MAFAKCENDIFILFPIILYFEYWTRNRHFPPMTLKSSRFCETSQTPENSRRRLEQDGMVKWEDYSDVNTWQEFLDEFRPSSSRAIAQNVSSMANCSMYTEVAIASPHTSLWPCTHCYALSWELRCELKTASSLGSFGGLSHLAFETLRAQILEYQLDFPLHLFLFSPSYSSFSNSSSSFTPANGRAFSTDVHDTDLNANAMASELSVQCLFVSFTDKQFEIRSRC